MEIAKQRLDDGSINYIHLCLHTATGCDPSEGEYELHLTAFIGFLDLCSAGGVDDISLIKDCIANHLDELNLPEEGATEIILKESGEWEDVFWHKYYEVERVNRYD